MPVGGNFALSASPQAVALAQGQTAHSFIVIERFDGFASSVAFSASGLPAGVTAVFATPTAAAGNDTTLALSATPTAALGFAQVLVTATGGGSFRTLTLDLFVSEPPVPDFTLSASAASVALAQGASAPVFISIARINGFAAGVAFSAGGLPGGVTASFDPASATGDSTTLTLTASPTATMGSSMITVTGVGGGLTRTMTINLFVSETAGGDFAISASPGALTLIPSEPAQAFVAISRAGFAGAVSFSVTGLPSGVTATFEPLSTAGNSTVLTLTAAASTLQAFANVEITGAGGGLMRGTTIFLFVDGVPALQ